MRGSLGSLESEARISIARHARSGVWLSQEMFEPRVVLLNSMRGPRRSTLLTRTCAVAIASALIFGRLPTTSGLSGTTEPLVFPMRGQFRQRSSRIRFTTTRLPSALVVDPMAGGGTTVDVCQSMGRRCLAYDIQPTRPEIRPHDIRHGFPDEAAGCDLIFCDPPYHTMLARQYASESIAAVPFSEWITFLHDFARHAFAVLRPGGYLALLLAAQTEKDVLPGFGYLDHAFFGYSAALHAGFLPERRISCPMEGAYMPQHVRRARQEGRLLGQVRDLLVLRKTSHIREVSPPNVLSMQGLSDCELAITRIPS